MLTGRLCNCFSADENVCEPRQNDAADRQGRRGNSGLRHGDRKSVPQGSPGMEGDTGKDPAMSSCTV